MKKILIWLKKPLDSYHKIRLFSVISCVGFIAALVYCFVQGTVFHKQFPYNTFLFYSEDRFYDFFNIYSYQGIVYSFFTTVLLRCLKTLGIANAFWIFLFSVLLAYVYCIYEGISVVKKHRILYALLIIFCLYPFWFVIDRLNFEIVIFLLLNVAFMFWRRERWYLTMLFVSIAIAMKYFPIVFVFIFLTKKKYNLAILSVVLAVILNLIPAAIYPDIQGNIRFLLGYYGEYYSKQFALGNSGLFFGHTLYGLVKSCIIYFSSPNNIYVTFWFHLYPYISFPLFAFLIWFALFKEKTFWKQMMILTISITLLPYVSADYKLLHLLIPLFFFFREHRDWKFDRLYTILFGLLFIPKPYMHFLRSIPMVNIGVVLNPVIMISFVILFVYSNRPIRSNK